LAGLAAPETSSRKNNPERITVATSHASHKPFAPATSRLNAASGIGAAVMATVVATSTPPSPAAIELDRPDPIRVAIAMIGSAQSR
jgi:hypothetical protein